LANEFGESQSTINEWVRIYNEQTTAAQNFETEMENTQVKMQSLEADLDIATAALDRMASAAQSAASALSSAASTGMNSGQYYNAYYGGQIPSHAAGLDYVPRDNYLAFLHKGERIQTAAEASLSRQFGLATPATDWGAISSMMGDSIKPGGNVYLDGRVVGEVISDRQGRSYKSLQRSGWQS
jgi:hypothetical protein